MDKHTYCVIMASRFGPKSRQSKPKQFLDILGTGKSFIRMTYERFEKLAPAENFLVVTNARYKDLVLEQIPELGPEQVLCEPVGRNTAPCICYAAYGLQKRDPGAKMIVTPADHLILNEEDFRAIIGECLDFIDDRAALMTVGIKPTRPETGYGYIQVSDDRTISKVKCFTEKPNLELAQTFLQCGEFLWNSGIFVWKVGDIIEAVRTYLPEHHALFSDIQPVLGTSEEAEAIARVFSECRSISIDYGVMEKANNVYVRRGEFGWSDVGTWGSLYQHARKDRYANAKPEKGCYTDENTRSCIVSLPEGRHQRPEGVHRGGYGGRAADLSAQRGTEHQEVHRRSEIQRRRQTYLRATTFPLRRGFRSRRDFRKGKCPSPGFPSASVPLFFWTRKT